MNTLQDFDVERIQWWWAKLKKNNQRQTEVKDGTFESTKHQNKVCVADTLGIGQAFGSKSPLGILKAGILAVMIVELGNYEP